MAYAILIIGLLYFWLLAFIIGLSHINVRYVEERLDIIHTQLLDLCQQIDDLASRLPRKKKPNIPDWLRPA